MMALLALGYNAWGDNLNVNTLTMMAGETKTLSVGFENPNRNYIAFEFYMQLPEGFTIATNSNNRLVLVLNENRDNGHATSLANDGNGVYHFLAYHTENLPFLGNSGELFSLQIVAASNLENGTYSATIYNQVFSDTDKNRCEFENVNFNIVIDGQDDGRIKFNESSSVLPAYTAGEKGNVTMTRTIKKNVWNTIVLPFNLTKSNATAVFGSDVEFAKFSGFEVDYGDDENNVIPLGITMNFTTYTIPVRGNLAGGTPVLIKTSQDITEPFQLDNVTLTEGVTDEENTFDLDGFVIPGKFTGSLVKTVVPADGLFISDNQFWYSVGATNIKAFRGWFELGAVYDKETDFGAKISFTIDDTPTAVDGIPSREQLPTGRVYTLGGQLVGKDIPVSQLKEGVYIVNGKCIYVK